MIEFVQVDDGNIVFCLSMSTWNMLCYVFDIKNKQVNSDIFFGFNDIFPHFTINNGIVSSESNPEFTELFNLTNTIWSLAFTVCTPKKVIYEECKTQ